MKKTIIVSAMALCFSIVSMNATTLNPSVKNYNVEAYFKVNSFCVSIAKGDIETVQKLIERGADVNVKSNGMTPAMYAAKFNRVEILKLLISKGAKLKVRSDKNKTAADYAELHGAHEALAVIKEKLAKKKKRK
ncbi:ankyrin repeat domain-containing protein [Tamlana sp. 2201CG12-4]|uniref:ankyrin repeat domain-containing protein n=1 Tax=Tamlana sp. 2201CG12-4 TaxID=3112582 RepID=UPI002DC04512|nr:ankyrin repeat domain-containing protein [Tamlana sp. 2201CG12-4]MEC3905493.1 ankyrin repeat domain-containing protein [Tamlana sp. 2201CG12-4]